MLSKPLHIGIVCYPSIGGSGIVATNLGYALAQAGHCVHFISYDKPFRLKPDRVRLFFHKVKINQYSLFKYPDYTLPLAEKISEVHQKYALDILHVHYAVPHATAALLARQILESAGLKPPRVITTLHGTDITLLAKDPNLFNIIRYSIESSCGVTAVSQSLKKETQRVLKTSCPIEVIYNFYTPKFPKASRQVLRRRLGAKPGDFLAVHSSNLRAVKLVPDLLKIAARLKSEPRFKLLILAGGNFAPYRPLVKKLGIAKKLLIRPAVLDIENYLPAADLGLYPSQTESFGMGILEAMSFGAPVLATRAGGIPEVIDDGQTGFLFKVGDIAGYAKKIKELMQKPKLLKRLGAAAKARAQTQFSAKKITQEYLGYYRKILKTKASREC